MPEEPFRCGFIAVVGRPNVGKSTLINALVGHKISIVTPKPQTTRQRVLGIHTTPRAQYIFVDTPGMHTGGRRVLNRQMNRTALHAMEAADVVLLVVEALQWSGEDQQALTQCMAMRRPLGLVVNKIDKAKPRTVLLPYLENLQSQAAFAFVLPLAATSGENLAELEKVLHGLLPESPVLFPAEQITDQAETARAAEFVREQLMQMLAKELPYSIAVQVEEFKHEGKLLRIGAVIWVERESQKAIVIGRGGQLLKAVGHAARLELQQEFGCKVFLRLWVKMRDDWADDEIALRSLGLGSS
ncbi:MAG: GTPase Era [Gammaproteobacteria bacterium]|nr:GTPase Era [Gammaproteobacteria bacterium]